jgi:hypothetical protein
VAYGGKNDLVTLSSKTKDLPKPALFPLPPSLKALGAKEKTAKEDTSHQDVLTLTRVNSRGHVSTLLTPVLLRGEMASLLKKASYKAFEADSHPTIIDLGEMWKLLKAHAHSLSSVIHVLSPLFFTRFEEDADSYLLDRLFFIMEEAKTHYSISTVDDIKEVLGLIVTEIGPSRLIKAFDSHVDATCKSTQLHMEDLETAIYIGLLNCERLLAPKEARLQGAFCSSPDAVALADCGTFFCFCVLGLCFTGN